MHMHIHFFAQVSDSPQKWADIRCHRVPLLTCPPALPPASANQSKEAAQVGHLLPSGASKAICPVI
eukprot:7323849-Karenia_brevis.AAC.1